MNNTFNKIKAEQIRSMFFILKILTLFFCSSPIFQSTFKGTKSRDTLNSNLFATAVGLIILFIVIIFWFVINEKKKKRKAIIALEISVFFLLCVFSIYISGLYLSNYKFLFIFLIVAYTIEYDMRVGMIIASLSSAFILITDLMHDSGQSVNVYFENDLALSSMFFIIAWTLGYYVNLERKHIDTLLNFVNRDSLTNLYNHRYFHEYLKDYYDKKKYTDNPISLIMMDLDEFKVYNDIFGHQKGDHILQTIAKLLTSNLKKDYLVCRYGGEEFGIILPGVLKEEAALVASTLKEIIDSYKFEGQDHMPKQNLTISAGVSQSQIDDDLHTALIERTDSALYRAKFLCSNRVEKFASVFDEFSYSHGKDSQLIAALQPVKTLITVINSRDSYTYNHIERVVLYCEKIADYMEMDYDTKKQLICAAYLHDLGKINISKELLISDQTITNEQWEALKKHPKDSADIISQVPELKNLVPIVLSHHERFDGRGYPHGLKGNEIPFLARVLSLADSFDAMTHRRPYKPTKTVKQAYEEIRRCSGSQFDPELTEIFITAMESEDVGKTDSK